MINIKNNVLTIDGNSKPIKDINIIQSINGKLYYSNRIVEISKNPCDIKELHKEFQENGLDNFVLLENIIFNIENISSVYIKFFQYAGISLIQCNQGVAETYMLALNCKNGETVTIPFRTWKEVEAFYHKVDIELAEFHNGKGLIK